MLKFFELVPPAFKYMWKLNFEARIILCKKEKEHKHKDIT
jgi:hypothetical protein